MVATNRSLEMHTLHFDELKKKKKFYRYEKLQLKKFFLIKINEMRYFKFFDPVAVVAEGLRK